MTLFNGLVASAGPDNLDFVDNPVGLPSADNPPGYTPTKSASSLGALNGLLTSGAWGLVITDSDSNADVRRHVIDALGEIGDVKSLDALTRALKDEDAAVRRHAAAAIAEVSGDSTGPHPHPHPHPHPRECDFEHPHPHDRTSKIRHPH